MIDYKTGEAETEGGETIQLTEEELAVAKAVRRLENVCKKGTGRLMIFCGDTFSVRVVDKIGMYEGEQIIETYTIPCDGGDSCSNQHDPLAEEIARRRHRWEDIEE